MARLTSVLERYIILSWAIIGVCALVALYWALDRTPPFAMTDYTVTNSTRGETAYINAHVKRDLSRDCPVRFSRYLYSGGVRHEISGVQYMSAAAIADMDKQMPDALRLAVRIPADVPVGSATLVTALEYTCNPIHTIYPIEVLLEMRLVVLP